MYMLRIVACSLILLVAECFWSSPAWRKGYKGPQSTTPDYDYTTLEPECWWGSWGAWSACNGTCSPLSMKHRSRQCLPELCADCWNQSSDTQKEEQRCDAPCCKGYPKWKNWEPWSDCSESCGDGGTQSRIRWCDYCQKMVNKTSSVSYRRVWCGKLKETSTTQERPCEEKLPCCIVYDKWGKWGNWSDCSATCGKSVKTRERRCLKDKECPSEKFWQNLCGDKKVDTKTKKCDVPCCPEPASWSEWGEWSECSVSCGQGQRTRKRKCKKAKCSDVTTCEGKRKQTEKCTTCKKCKEPKLGEWGPWSKCSVSCGKGEMQRTRDCKSKHKCQRQCEEKHKMRKKNCRNKC